MSKEPIEYENAWGDAEKLYTDTMPRGVKITFSTQRRTNLYCIPYDKLDELIDDLTNLKEAK